MYYWTRGGQSALEKKVKMAGTSDGSETTANTTR